MAIYSHLQIEASYSSILILLWAIALAKLTWIANFPIKGMIVLALSTVVLTSPDRESWILLPMLFLSESLLDNVIFLNRPPLEFYASTFLSCLTLIFSGLFQMERRKRNIYCEVIMYAVAGFVLVLCALEGYIAFFGFGAFVSFGFLFFLALRPILGENESVLVSSLAGFYICDAVTNNNVNEKEILSQTHTFITPNTHIMGRGCVLSAVFMVIVMFIGSKFCIEPRINSSKSTCCDVNVRRITIFYWCSLISIIAGVHMAVSTQLNESATLWLLNYIRSSPYRMGVLITWAHALPLLIFCVEKFTGGLRKTVRRKMFHFIAVVLFTPVSLVDPHFLSLSLSIASSLTILVELARFYRVYGSSTLSRFISSHIDCRDAIDGAVRTHIYLIYGLGFSMTLCCRWERLHSVVKVSRVMDFSINLIPGIVALGVVDACAAVVGSTFFLSHRRALGEYLNNGLFTEKANFPITHKTTTGTLGGLLCGVVFWMFILLITGSVEKEAAGFSFILIFLSSVTECFMGGVDNLQLPMVVTGVTNTLFAFLL